MKVFNKKFEILETERGYKNIPVDKEIIEEIRTILFNEIDSYFLVPVELRYNINNYSNEWKLIINKYLDTLETLEDVIKLCNVSLRNSKLGNRILVFNLSGYFNCSGLLNGWCNCSKTCYAGAMQFKQLKKNIRNSIFINYCKLTNNMALFNYGVKKASNEEMHEVNTLLYEIRAIRFDEAGEIKNMDDILLLESITKLYNFNSKKAYTYTTNPLIDNHSSDIITINKSCGFDYNAIIPDGYNSFTCIINEPEEIINIWDKFHDIINITVCSGSCRVCRGCSKNNNLVVFMHHGHLTQEALESKIIETMEILESLKRGCKHESNI